MNLFPPPCPTREPLVCAENNRCFLNRGGAGQVSLWSTERKSRLSLFVAQTTTESSPSDVTYWSLYVTRLDQSSLYICIFSFPPLMLPYTLCSTLSCIVRTPARIPMLLYCSSYVDEWNYLYITVHLMLCIICG